MDWDVVRARIRQGLCDGSLPQNRGIRVSGGCGDDEVCACCGLAITRGQTRLMIDNQVRLECTQLRLSMHPQCAHLWFEEADALATRRLLNPTNTVSD